jgi:hypothetical protein
MSGIDRVIDPTVIAVACFQEIRRANGGEIVAMYLGRHPSTATTARPLSGLGN